ncbi:hypothetical protein [Microbacterium gorillae]|uniref:hypothetical protein n=1 Tax=Microbacterium gorillae TaxID=1231063 RepID=UPI003D962941
MSMMPSEDEAVARQLLGNPERWRNEPAARQAAEVRSGLAQARAIRAQSILTYLTADRSSWPAEVDQMMRSELGIDQLPGIEPQLPHSGPDLNEHDTVSMPDVPPLPDELMLPDGPPAGSIVPWTT